MKQIKIKSKKWLEGANAFMFDLLKLPTYSRWTYCFHSFRELWASRKIDEED